MAADSAGALLGVPDVCQEHSGIDDMGQACRIAPSVSIMRWGAGRAIRLADEVSIYDNTRLVLGDVTAAPEVGIRIGARTIINVGCYLSGEGGLDIGADVLVGAHVRLLSAGHAIDEGSSIIARNRITRARVTVGDGAWIGAGATVLEGVTIGQGAVVAAGAVVRTDVPDGAIAAGVPARIIRQRQLPQYASASAPAQPHHASWLRRLWLRLSGRSGRG